MKALTGFLKEIAELTQARNQSAKTRLREEDLFEVAASLTRKPKSLSQSLKSGSGIIAEIKRQSPSKGRIADLDPVSVARDYIDAGASAISVLTEPTHFGGSLQDLEKVRKRFPDAVLLMKDFVIERYQILQARVYGADAVLLIAALLEPALLRSLYATAVELGLEVLVEVHDRNEIALANSIDAKIVGINNRNLSTLKTDLEVSRKLIRYRPPETLMISESGIESRDDIVELKDLGFDGFLVGTALMQEKSPGASLLAMLKR